MSSEFFDGTGILTPKRNCYTSPVNKTIPTKLSELENDMNFITDSEYQHTDNNFTDDYKNILDNNIDLPQTLEETKTAIKKANDAADLATEKAEVAVAVTDEARQSITKADAASKSANTAADRANQAVININNTLVDKFQAHYVVKSSDGSYNLESDSNY